MAVRNLKRNIADWQLRLRSHFSPVSFLGAAIALLGAAETLDWFPTDEWRPQKGDMVWLAGIVGLSVFHLASLLARSQSNWRTAPRMLLAALAPSIFLSGWSASLAPFLGLLCFGGFLTGLVLIPFKPKSLDGYCVIGAYFVLMWALQGSWIAD